MPTLSLGDMLWEKGRQQSPRSFSLLVIIIVLKQVAWIRRIYPSDLNCSNKSSQKTLERMRCQSGQNFRSAKERLECQMTKICLCT